MVLQAVLATWTGKLIVGGFAVLASLRYGTGLYAWRETEKLERPSYVVLQKLSEGVELRRYEPYLIAETTVEGTGFRKPTGDGFRSCAGYIFGKNKPRRGRGMEAEKMAMTAPVRITGSAQVSPVGEKMAMTAPVRLNGGQAKKTKVSFVIGKQYSLKTAPTPMDKSVRLRQVQGHTLAVKTFNGPPPSDERVVAERAKVEKALAAAEIQPKSSETFVYGYHDPFITPNFLRRNEVAVLVEGSA